jgi:hypothetical protein
MVDAKIRVQRIETARSTPIWQYALTALVPAGVLAAVASTSPELQEQMFRDTYDAVQRMEPWHFPPVLGIVSNFGIVLWCAAWAITGFAAVALLYKRQLHFGLFLMVQSFISGLLMTDDLLLIHEQAYRIDLHEAVVFLFYVILIAAWVVVFRSVLGRLGAGLLIVAGVAFAMSITGDQLNHFPHDLGILQRWMEDATKLVGIAFWTAFAIRGSWILLDFGRSEAAS